MILGVDSESLRGLARRELGQVQRRPGLRAIEFKLGEKTKAGHQVDLVDCVTGSRVIETLEVVSRLLELGSGGHQLPDPELDLTED